MVLYLFCIYLYGSSVFLEVLRYGICSLYFPTLSILSFLRTTDFMLSSAGTVLFLKVSVKEVLDSGGAFPCAPFIISSQTYS